MLYSKYRFNKRKRRSHALKYASEINKNAIGLYVVPWQAINGLLAQTFWITPQTVLH